MSVILGVDIGIASLGWALVEYDESNGERNRIIDAGVRIFTKAEHPKDQSSLALPRRKARLARRRLARIRKRMAKIRRLFVQYGLITEEELALIEENEGQGFYTFAKRDPRFIDIWRLRHEALSRKIDGREFARVLTHIAKRRGFKFVTKSEEKKIKEEGKKEDEKKMLSGIQSLQEKFAISGCETIGSYIYVTNQHPCERKRNRQKGGDPTYDHTFSRDLLEKEIRTIFAKQKALGNELASDEFLDKYWSVAAHIKEPPSIEKMVGYCKYDGEKRAPKSAPSVEKFILLGKVVNARLITAPNEEGKTLADFAGSWENAAQKTLEAAQKNKSGATYKSIRKAFNIGDEYAFKGLSYTEGKEAVDAEKKIFAQTPAYHSFKEAIGEEKLNDLLANVELADEIARVLSVEKSDSKKSHGLRQAFLQYAFDQTIADELVDKLIAISFDKFVEFSLSVIRAINPRMQAGKRTNEALDEAGFHLPEPAKKEFLPPLEVKDPKVRRFLEEKGLWDQTAQMDLKNPVVARAFAQFRKTLNAIIRKHGHFDLMHIELAREINSKADRIQIEKAIAKNTRANEDAKRWIEENGRGAKVNGTNIVKIKLWLQQNERCVYTGENIPREWLFKEGLLEVDHILPYSRSFDDSISNKVLCRKEVNQEKKNRTPYEWIFEPTGKRDQKAWDEFDKRARSFHFDKVKRDKLFKDNFSDEQSEKSFINRHLNDTRYMARLIKNYVEAHLLFSGNERLPVRVRSGRLTSDLRHLWGLEDKDRSSDLHHAQDAIILAFSTQSITQRLSEYYRRREENKKKNIRETFAEPLPSLRQKVKEVLEPLANPDLSLDLKGQRIVSRAVRKKVTGAAHEQSIKSPTEEKDVDKKVKVNKGKGVCDNGEMVRTDVFTDGKKFYYVPIYVADMIKPETPNMAIKALAPREQWIPITEEHEFLFSLHKDDLVRVKKGARDLLGYYMKVDSATANVAIRSVDNSANGLFKPKDKSGVFRIGGATLDLIEKYQVDPLGVISKVKGEKRAPTIPITRAAKKLKSKGKS
ncbi:MAG: type II CRISPR RNA-guided endonuclease Cas9 [Helicobacteraceae bacterium]|jgi:CRISPR-associated endonuclease Csn1|nr:type II CRISPR RNA-guided endonuclease Cas9 [Helicobacteraceae bacterium]